MKGFPRSVMRRLVLAYSVRNRERKARLIADFMRQHEVRTVLLVGSSTITSRNEGIVERRITEHADLVASTDIADRRGVEWPFFVADGRHLPVAERAVDMVLANAVIEHVGDEADQARFVAEQTRVGRGWVITTPNRWFPVESHTSALFRHWSPAWSASRQEFTRLLSRREFARLLPDDAVIHGRPWSATFTATWWSS
ncbi:class I SAM-dependent methyltransferase [Janibacter sp. GXQ6167]|uniref:class I SAM-dependent methyltransferase n=1 Tax=Janibacter sp. GXQ6167 TaxID=3240791 RepID=UPI0035235EB3